MAICTSGMHVVYFMFVHFRLFPVFDFGLAHYDSEPCKWPISTVHLNFQASHQSRESWWPVTKTLTGKRIIPTNLLNLSPSYYQCGVQCCCIEVSIGISIKPNVRTNVWAKLVRCEDWAEIHDIAMTRTSLDTRNSSVAAIEPVSFLMEGTKDECWKHQVDHLQAVYVTSFDVWVNSLPTNDGKCRHDLCELSISLWEFIWGV